jgi:hypothetical protein
LSSKYELNEKYLNFKDDLFSIKKHFDKSKESIHKARNELRIAPINNIQTVIKAFKIPHIINRVVYAYFRDSKAKKSYLNGIELIKRGISTPEPIGYIEHYKLGLFEKSYFLSVYEPYDFTIREALHHKLDDYKDVLKAFANFTYSLHVKGVWHIDYSPGNILIRKKEKDYEFFIVDINRMEFKTISGYDGLENFNKLWAQDEDMKLMAKEYAKLANLDEQKAIKTAIEFNQKHKAKIELKRKLKGK